MKALLLFGRILFSLIFLFSGFAHFLGKTIAYGASVGIPMASFLVPLSGVIAIIGALCIILGFKAKLGAVLILIFLIPITFKMHQFWNIADPMMMQLQMSLFMKNISMMGGALIIAYFGAGPLSIDGRKR